MRLAMDFQPHFPWCFIVLLAVSTFIETHIPQRRDSSEKVAFLSSKRNVRTTHSGIVGRKYKGSSSNLSPSEPQQAVVVNCYGDSMAVVVKSDLFDTGILVDARYLQLGSSSGNTSADAECGAVPAGEEEFTIRVHLTDCGTKLSVVNEKIIYSNDLVYSPEPSPDGMLRLGATTIPVECHYHTRYSVDGIALQPTWAQFASVITAEDQIDFRLWLMTDDWQSERGSHNYFIGDPIHLEVSIIMRHHMSLRVYVDHCFATPTPDTESSLRYDFIEHHGCLADSHLTSSSSKFLHRADEHKLRFQLDAFRFYQSTNLIYLTCHVKAVPAALAVDPRNRACTFTDNGWWSVDGNDQACRSCDVSQWFEQRELAEPLPNTIPTTARAPMAVKGHTDWTGSKQNPAHYFFLRPDIRQTEHSDAQQSSLPVVLKRGDDSRADWSKTTHFGPLVILPTKVFTKEAVSTPTSLAASHETEFHSRECTNGEKCDS